MCLSLLPVPMSTPLVIVLHLSSGHWFLNVAVMWEVFGNPRTSLIVPTLREQPALARQPFHFPMESSDVICTTSRPGPETSLMGETPLSTYKI